MIRNGGGKEKTGCAMCNAFAFPKSSRGACAKAAQPPIWVEMRQRGKYRYRIFDGMHRTRAAKLAGRKTVEAIVSSNRGDGLAGPRLVEDNNKKSL
jgi:uncharacterized ParB-like nuclease family protein